MSLPPSDRALRRLVAEIADYRPADVASVLEELDADQRKSVLALLEEYKGAAGPSATAVQPSSLPPTIPGLSGWLQARIDGDGLAAPDLAMSDGYLWGEDRAATTFAMTSAARAALLECADGVRPNPQPGAPLDSASPLLGFLRRLPFGARR